MFRKIANGWISLRNAWRARSTADKSPPELFSSGAIQAYSVGLIAFLYFLGWMFLFYYLRQFGLDIFSLDVPFHYFIVYAFATITFAWSEAWWGVLLVVLIAPGIVIAVQALFSLASSGRVPAWVGLAASALLVLLVGGLFFVGHSVAQAAGVWNYKKVRFSPQAFYEFTFRSESRSDSAARSNATGSALDDPFLTVLRLPSFIPNKQVIPIIETQDRYFVLVQMVDVNAPITLRGVSRVVEINRDDVLFARLTLREEMLTQGEQDELGRKP